MLTSLNRTSRPMSDGPDPKYLNSYLRLMFSAPGWERRVCVRDFWVEGRAKCARNRRYHDRNGPLSEAKEADRGASWVSRRGSGHPDRSAYPFWFFKTACVQPPATAYLVQDLMLFSSRSSFRGAMPSTWWKRSVLETHIDCQCCSRDKVSSAVRLRASTSRAFSITYKNAKMTGRCVI